MRAATWWWQARRHNNNSYDFLTIKYSSVGAALWTNRYDGGETNDDNALALAVDATVKYVTVPPLSISLTTTNKAVISWPFPSADFYLEQNPDLKSVTKGEGHRLPGGPLSSRIREGR